MRANFLDEYLSGVSRSMKAEAIDKIFGDIKPSPHKKEHRSFDDYLKEELNKGKERV